MGPEQQVVHTPAEDYIHWPDNISEGFSIFSLPKVPKRANENRRPYFAQRRSIPEVPSSGLHINMNRANGRPKWLDRREEKE
jgi:hypothetical protein